MVHTSNIEAQKPSFREKFRVTEQIDEDQDEDSQRHFDESRNLSRQARPDKFSLLSDTSQSQRELKPQGTDQYGPVSIGSGEYQEDAASGSGSSHRGRAN